MDLETRTKSVEYGAYLVNSAGFTKDSCECAAQPQWNWLSRTPGVVDCPAKHDKHRSSGTDPSKYKTAICRNWEIDGICHFKGCTFAHGKEELRIPRLSLDHDVPSTETLKQSIHFDQSYTFKEKTTLGKNISQVCESNEDSASRVDQSLRDLSDAIQRERESYSTNLHGIKAIEILIHREEAYKMQLSRDKKEIHDLKDRVQYLENIIAHSRASSIESKEKMILLGHQSLSLKGKMSNLDKKAQQRIDSVRSPDIDECERPQPIDSMEKLCENPSKTLYPFPAQ